jgi:Xaa-Pro aminopeptidase
MTDSLALLRAQLAKQNLDGFILPVNDEFMGEYVPDCAKRLEWLTGFSGSAGMAVVLKDKCAFFTDGRYTLQAETEVDAQYERYNSGEMSPEQWIQENAPLDSVIGYDPKLHTLSAVQRYQETAHGVVWSPVTPNPVDSIWVGRPAAPFSPVRIHGLEVAGEDSATKRMRVANAIVAKGADTLILTAPDSICWLLNIRGNDVPFTPFVLCYAVLDALGKVTLYVDEARIAPKVHQHLGQDVRLRMPSLLEADIAEPKGARVMLDPASAPVWFYQAVSAAGASVIKHTDPCQRLKACKNPVELDGTRAAHLRDGLAETKFLYWLDTAVERGEPLTEMGVAEKLEDFRKESSLYLEPSFTTICGSGPNGAIVHYRVSEASNRPLAKDAILLLDSGGQYADGTTDITRTIAIGTPSAEMKDRFTRVLKGHIALARAQFPQGTTGGQLDGFARQYLWQQGLDYDHGTGHGVGSYLSVHEGPQRISKRGGDVSLEPGMILSNEPGYYKNGAYGIRIENLVVVTEMEQAHGRRFYGFETITLVPLDLRLVEFELLDEGEKQWLEDYHNRVLEAHSGQLSVEERQWLKRSMSTGVSLLNV